MLKKFLSVTLLIIATSITAKAQTGINTKTPVTTLEIKASNMANPSSSDGVIVPRVTQLNITDTKEKGLLVFYDKEDPTTLEVERGFYYWDGVKWIPFFSMNKITTNQTIVFANYKSTFNEGSFTLSSSESDTRTLGFAGPVSPSSVASLYTINASGELVIGKKGWYDITNIVALNVIASGGLRRDAFELTVLVNGTASAIITSYGFPNSGNDYDITSGIVQGGALKLDVGNRLSLRVFRYNRGDSSNLNGSTVITTNLVGALSNITLRYMGDF